MFDQDTDDIPTQGGPTPPPNLPVAEPEDMFSDADQAEPLETSSSLGERTSAVDAGVLRPKAGGVSPSFDSLPQPVEPVLRSDSDIPSPLSSGEFDQYKIEEPSFLRTILLIVGTIILVGALAFGGWWAYNTYIAPGDQVIEPSNDDIVIPGEDDTTSENTDTNTEEQFDDRVIFGDVKDSDGDGLEDSEERSLGTNPQEVDSDSDGLTDYEEIKIWKTNPLSTDSDNDTFVDGQEVKNGYNPAGPGRILEPPTDPNDLNAFVSSSEGVAVVSRVNGVEEDTPVIATCGEDMACAVSAAANCRAASVHYKTIADLQSSFGVTQSITLYLAVRPPLVSGECEFLIRTEEIKITYASTVPAESQAEQEQYARDLEGREGRCRLAPKALADMLTRWRKATPQAKDFGASCAGSFFEKPIF